MADQEHTSQEFLLTIVPVTWPIRPWLVNLWQ